MRRTVGGVVTTAVATVAYGVVRTVGNPGVRNRFWYRSWQRSPIRTSTR